MKYAFSLLLLAGCDPLAHEEPRPCNDGPSLHAFVDLSDPSCRGVTPSVVMVRFPDSAVTSTTMTYQDLTPPIVEYEWAWPSQVADGATLWLSWYGYGQDSVTGRADADTTAHPGTCQVVEMAVTCGVFFVDAQP